MLVRVRLLTRRLADGLRRADPSLSEAQAISKAAADRPDLYQRYHDRKLAEIAEAGQTA